ncbi:hypothetical protein, partial [Listeria monocytogenes]|uniref:hypothetical protein n=1 Tax=Listeria monocytogenes TaxID=1639 RepID=UPI002FDBA5FB
MKRLDNCSPHDILKEYAEAINNKYDDYLKSIIVKGQVLDFPNLTKYTLYLEAAIGKGYNSSLLDIIYDHFYFY